ncbi:MAG: excinuclease ABC subunit B, partial [bacterium]|nr:excinuclease ABC subunit B [bacterium]
GKVIMYADTIARSMDKAIRETNRRREMQEEHNRKHNITPAQITKQIKDFYDDDYWIKKSEEEINASFKNRESLEKEIGKLTEKMKEKAGNLDFKAAAVLRDKIKEYKNMMLEMF